MKDNIPAPLTNRFLDFPRFDEAEKEQLLKTLNFRDFNLYFILTQRESTLGSTYLLLIENVPKLQVKDPEIEYWITCTYGKDGKAYGHGLLKTDLTHRDIKKCFSKGSFSPQLKPIYERSNLIEFCVKYAVKDTQFTTLKRSN